MQDGHFREDLFFRLNIVCITLPPLRQRRDEITTLTEYFLARYSEHYNKPPLAMATDTLRLFAEYDWPGNVRELENLVRRMVILGSDTAIRLEVADAIAGRYLRVGPIPALRPAVPGALAAVPAPPAADRRRPPRPQRLPPPCPCLPLKRRPCQAPSRTSGGRPRASRSAS